MDLFEQISRLLLQLVKLRLKKSVNSSMISLISWKDFQTTLEKKMILFGKARWDSIKTPPPFYLVNIQLYDINNDFRKPTQILNRDDKQQWERGSPYWIPILSLINFVGEPSTRNRVRCHQDACLNQLSKDTIYCSTSSLTSHSWHPNGWNQTFQENQLRSLHALRCRNC